MAQFRSSWEDHVTWICTTTLVNKRKRKGDLTLSKNNILFIRISSWQKCMPSFKVLLLVHMENPWWGAIPSSGLLIYMTANCIFTPPFFWQCLTFLLQIACSFRMRMKREGEREMDIASSCNSWFKVSSFCLELQLLFLTFFSNGFSPLFIASWNKSIWCFHLPNAKETWQ